jgi:DNA-3-methyladenine glycosylase
MVLPKRFFNQSTLDLAQALLGATLVHETREGKASGRIVETEAYLYQNDPACHASRGITPRNEAMFARAGVSYVYQIYGMYFCFNVVSAPENVGEAVLVRALEPIQGIGLMQERRKTKKIKDLCSGPGKLCQALAINREQNQLDLRTSALKLNKMKDMGSISRQNIVCTTRIGINQGKELPYRYYVADSEFVSKR